MKMARKRGLAGGKGAAKSQPRKTRTQMPRIWHLTRKGVWKKLTAAGAGIKQRGLERIEGKV